MSSAVRDGRLSSDEKFSEVDRILERLARVESPGSRKGLREVGRGGGSSKGELGLGRPCEEVRLRKGLFEGRFRSSPGERDCSKSAVRE